MYRVSCKNLNHGNAVEYSVRIYLVMHLLCLNDFSCLDALPFLAEIFTTGLCLDLLPCVNLIAPETVLSL